MRNDKHGERERERKWYQLAYGITNKAAASPSPSPQPYTRLPHYIPDEVRRRGRKLLF